ncbi:MAG: acyl carrier protein [Myxococcota bacterium]
MSDASVRQAVREFILTNLLPGEAPETLDDSEPLVTSGVITSLSLLEIVSFLEVRFSIELDVHDLGVSRMDSVDLIVDLVIERAGGAPPQRGG